MSGPAAILGKIAGDNQTWGPGNQLPVSPAVRVTDANGNAVSGAAVTFAVLSGGGSATGVSQTTDSGGFAVIGSWTLGPTRGANTLTATVSGAGSVTFTATAASTQFSIIVAAEQHSCAVGGGAAYCWGPHFEGLLGDGTNTDRLVPTAVAGGIAFTSVTGTYYHSCGLAVNGAGYCWGYNGGLGGITVVKALLGNGKSSGQSYVPDAVVGGLTFTTISAGGTHTCSIATNGSSYCWGKNRYGETGTGNGAIDVALLSPTQVVGGLSFSQISSGGSHSCGLVAAGTVYCFGRNSSGQLGDGGTSNRFSPGAVPGALSFVAVSAGGSHTCALTGAGAAYCWGSNDNGQLGNGTQTDALSPVAVAGGLTFSALSAGSLHTCGLATDGNAYCWGYNNSGQLGDGTQTVRLAPTRVVAPAGVAFTLVSAGGGPLGRHTCALTSDGAAYCWGDNTTGQLGDGTRTNRLLPTAVNPPQ